MGIAAPAVAFADDGATPAPATSASPAGGTAGPDHTQRWADRRGTFAEELGKELGVPQDRVEAALAKLRQQHRADHKGQGRPDGKSKADREAWLKTRLDKAVSDGKLTREQADAILAAVKAGVLPNWGGLGHGGLGHGGPRHGGPGHAGGNGDQTDAPTTK